ncbi:MAG: deoxynucleoside kinase [Ruminococcus sp.]|nr:deoxynucleoside kinase [Ruminococcus sp.]
MAGKFIVIEGLDGSGKATQTEILRKHFEASGKNVKKLSFPDYDNESSALVKMYLGGEFGDSPDDVNAYAAAAFYTVDRVASYLKFWKKDYENGAVILADRYATSNIIYQMSKLPESEWNNYIDFQQDFEYSKIKVPQPDLVIYLDVEPEVSQKLLSSRYSGDESKKDLHEKNVNFLLNCRKSALYAADRLGWVKISCTGDGAMRAIDEISADILNVIDNL